MIKMVKVDKAPEKSATASAIVAEFLEANMQTVKLDLSDEPEKTVQQVYMPIYQYLRNNPDLNVKVQMADGEIYLSKIPAATKN